MILSPSSTAWIWTQNCTEGTPLEASSFSTPAIHAASTLHSASGP